MKLSDLWNKLKENQRLFLEEDEEFEEYDKVVEEVVPEFQCDFAKLHFEKAEAVYRTEQSKSTEEELSEEEEAIIWQYASNHMAFFLSWLINRDFFIIESIADSDNTEEVVKAIKQVKNQKMTGYTFLSSYCDMKLCKNNVAESARDFAESYYNDKFKKDYKGFVKMVLGKEVNGFVFSWDEFDGFSGIIDIAYENFKLKNRV